MAAFLHSIGSPRIISGAFICRIHAGMYLFAGCRQVTGRKLNQSTESTKGKIKIKIVHTSFLRNLQALVKYQFIKVRMSEKPLLIGGFALPGFEKVKEKFRNLQALVKYQFIKVRMSEKPLLIGGFALPGFEKVKEKFRENLQSGLEKGGNFAAYYQGKLVVNVWGGHCDIDCRRPWKQDTLSTFFSSTKAVAAIVIAHLVDRGALDYNEKVCKYWPEFAQNGKGNITLKQLISNQAGLINLDEPFWLAEIRDDLPSLSRKLAAQKPFWQPGEKHGYHPLTFGLYLDQLVRRVDVQGRNLSQYFQDEIAKPFDIEFYIGLPKSLVHRATRLKFSKQMDREYMLSNFHGDLDLLLKTANNPRDFRSTLKMNDPDIRELPVPSTHGHGTAANAAKLFGIVANDGSVEGKQLLSKDALKRFTDPIVAGYDVYFGIDAAWSVGTHLITMVTGNQAHNHIFGHGGYGGQYAAADTKNKVGFAYTTCLMDPFSSYAGNGDERMYSLFDTLYNCVYEIEGIKEPRQTFQFYSKYKSYLEKSKL